MTMTPEEIVRHYSQAKNKAKDIKVLADLNSVTPGEIRAVLAEAGVEGVSAPKRPVSIAKPAAVPEQAPVSIPAPSVYDLIESVLTSMSAPYVSGQVRRSAADMLSALLADYLEERLGLKEDHREGRP